MGVNVSEPPRCERAEICVSWLLVFPSTRITVEIDARAVPIGGWLETGSGSRREFQGMLELLWLLEAARRQAAGEDVVSGPPGASARR
jgi:hypothetical protein